jgi:hypothetical protein
MNDTFSQDITVTMSAVSYVSGITLTLYGGRYSAAVRLRKRYASRVSVAYFWHLETVRR